jgi:hypothetical protein
MMDFGARLRGEQFTTEAVLSAWIRTHVEHRYKVDCEAELPNSILELLAFDRDQDGPKD